MSALKIITIVLFTACIARLFYLLWLYLAKKRHTKPIVAKIMRSSIADTSNTCVFRKFTSTNKYTSLPYISYFYNDKTYTNDSVKARDIIRYEQKKQNTTDYVLIYIDEDNPERFSCAPQPNYGLNVLYNVSWALVIAILYIIV